MALTRYNTPPIAELQVVELTADLPEHALHSSDRGTVVMVYGNGEGYEVEFIDAEGFTRALLTLKPDQVRPSRPRKVNSRAKISAQTQSTIPAVPRR